MTNGNIEKRMLELLSIEFIHKEGMDILSKCYEKIGPMDLESKSLLLKILKSDSKVISIWMVGTLALCLKKDSYVPLDDSLDEMDTKLTNLLRSKK